LSGWLYRSDRFWGDETVELVHRWLAWTMVGLVVVHVIGVLVVSRRHRENLVVAMIDGRKRMPSNDDIA
jgi:cytochrome b